MGAVGRKPRNKYGARRTVVDGYKFASKLEAARYVELRARARAGVIRDLERQCSYPVFWPGHEGDKKWLLFTYICDFRYVDVETGETIVEDTKGSLTNAPMATFRVKAKAVKFAYGIDIAVVTRKRTTWFFDKRPELRNYA